MGPGKLGLGRAQSSGSICSNNFIERDCLERKGTHVHVGKIIGAAVGPKNRCLLIHYWVVFFFRLEDIGGKTKSAEL